MTLGCRSVGALFDLEANTDVGTVYRVNWLRAKAAKARFDRWSEELMIVGHEMTWTVAWFEHQKGEWLKRTRERLKTTLGKGHMLRNRLQCGKCLWQRQNVDLPVT
jgi:hypothetical protein